MHTLKAEGIKNCFNPKHKKHLFTSLKAADNELYNNPNITICIGYKANIYVTLNKKSNTKITNILNDKTKFLKLQKNKKHTGSLKKTPQ